MIEAGACAIQIENQVSDAKMWTSRWKVTVPLMKILLIKMLLDTRS
jgi:isocitrate lyase